MHFSRLVKEFICNCIILTFLFSTGIHEYGNDWTLIQKTFIPTRTCVQIRTHAQKLFKAAGGVSAFSHLEDASQNSHRKTKEESVSTSTSQSVFESPMNSLKKRRKGNISSDLKVGDVEVLTMSENFQSPITKAQKRQDNSSEAVIATSSDAKDGCVAIATSIASEALASPTYRTPRGKKASHRNDDSDDHVVISPQEKSAPSIHHMRTRRRGQDYVTS